jgi:hypothetical protein
MAQIISNSVDFNQLNSSSYSIWKNAVIGGILGVVYILIYLAFRPLLPLAAASGIAMILTAVTGISAMVWQKMVQPLIIAVSTGAVLWGLAVWFDGLVWFEIAIWCMMLFSMAYVLFSGLIHHLRLIFALIAIVLIVIAARVVVGL